MLGSKSCIRAVTVGAVAASLCALSPAVTAQAQNPILVGAFTPDGTIITGADDEGTYSFKLVDPATLGYCYSEHGDGFRTTCARLQRQV